MASQTFREIVSTLISLLTNCLLDLASIPVEKFSQSFYETALSNPLYVYILFYEWRGLASFLHFKLKNHQPMVNSDTSKATKELLFSFILENLEYRKKCLYLQEIVSLGKADNVWQKALIAFFDTPMKTNPPATFCKN